MYFGIFEGAIAHLPPPPPRLGYAYGMAVASEALAEDEVTVRHVGCQHSVTT